MTDTHTQNDTTDQWIEETKKTVFGRQDASPTVHIDGKEVYINSITVDEDSITLYTTGEHMDTLSEAVPPWPTESMEVVIGGPFGETTASSVPNATYHWCGGHWSDECRHGYPCGGVYEVVFPTSD